MRKHIVGTFFSMASLLACGDGEVASSPQELVELGVQNDELLQQIGNDDSVEVALGRGRNSLTEEWQQRCVDGPIGTRQGSAQSRLQFDAQMSSAEMTDTLHAAFQGKAQFGLWSGGTQASFVRSTTSSQRSINMVYMHQVGLDSQVLDVTKLTWLVPKSDPAWLSRCGDSFASELRRGGSLYIMVRMDFASESEKAAFEGTLSGSYGPISAVAKLASSSYAFKDRSTVTIEAYQRGGETERLAAVLGRDSGANALTCSPSNVVPCLAFLGKAMGYATGTGPNDFPQNLRRAPGVNGVTVEDWGKVNAGPAVQDVPLAVLWTRAALALKFQTQIDVKNRYSALQRASFFGAPSAWRARADQYSRDAEVNASVIKLMAQKCYEKLSYPPTSAQVTACADANKSSALAALGFKDLSRWTTDLDVPLAKTSFQGRTDYVGSITPGVGFWGDWSSWAMCPAGTYMIGYKQRVEGYVGEDFDDTGLNSVSLVCADWPRSRVYRDVTPHPGVFGQWFPEATCTRGPAAGMKIVIEPRQGGDDGSLPWQTDHHDDTAANKVVSWCISGEVVEAPGGGPLGNASTAEFAYCPAGSGICGAQVRVEGDLGGGSDDTAMNGITLACCAL